MEPRSLALQKELFREESSGIHIKRHLERMEARILAGTLDHLLHDPASLVIEFTPRTPALGNVSISKAAVLVKKASEIVVSNRRASQKEEAYLHFRMPYEGEQAVFFIRPNNYYRSFPFAHVDESHVNFYLKQGAGRDAHRQFVEDRDLLVHYLDQVKDDFAAAKPRFLQRAEMVAERRTELMRRPSDLEA